MKFILTLFTELGTANLYAEKKTNALAGYALLEESPGCLRVQLHEDVRTGKNTGMLKLLKDSKPEVPA